MKLFDGLFSRSSARASDGPLMNSPAARPTIRITNDENTPTECLTKYQDSRESDLGNVRSLDNPQCSILHTESVVCNQMDSPSPQLPHTPQRLSTRGSRRLAGFKALLRTRKSHHHIAIPRQADAPSGVNPGWTPTLNACPIDLAKQDDQYLGGTIEPGRNKYLDIDAEVRKVSDTTTQSLNSEQTSGTVCRHPSRSTSTPIALVDREVTITQNPFTDTGNPLHPIPSYNPFSDPSTTTGGSTKQQSSEFSGPSTRFLNISGSSEVEEITLAERYPSSVMDELLPRKVSNSGKGLVKFDQHAAATAFNEIGPKLGLKPLKRVRSDGADTGSCDTGSNHNLPSEKKNTPRRTGIFKRVQSSLHLKVPTAATQPRPLRRMRTFAHFPLRSHNMTSLKGKSLDSLARLGGHSFLNLPVEFAPSTMRLPACYVATATYLKVFAPAVRNLFQDAGDLKTAARTYDYFARQVLSAEKEQDRIELTLRGSEMPIDLVEVLNQEAPGQNASQVLGVAWAFKALLAGLPGGILGSPELHCVLANIYYKHVGGMIGQEICKDDNRLMPGRGAKFTAIGLAILALTGPLQYNLICAVFGLSALLLQGTERSVELEKQELRGGDTSALMSAESLGRILGPLLTDDPKDERDMFRAIELEIESQRVAVMLVDGWVEVSRRLRRWQSRGLPAAARGGERRGCSLRSLQSRRTASSDDTGEDGRGVGAAFLQKG